MNATDYKKSEAFRKIQIFELPKIYTPGFPTYNPPTAEYVEIAMIDLEKFIYRSDNIDVLIKAALIFYQFQTISPFKNENGKIGRMLLNLLLKTRKILSKQLLCFSSYIFQNKSHYKEILTDVRVVGNYTRWIKFFVKGLIIEANNSINSINEQVKLKQKNREKIGALSKSKKSAIIVQEIKVLKAGNDLMRNRSYKYIEYLEILEGISFKTGQKEDEIYD